MKTMGKGTGEKSSNANEGPTTGGASGLVRERPARSTALVTRTIGLRQTCKRVIVNRPANDGD